MDSWTVEDTEEKLRGILAASPVHQSTDTKGHSESITCRVAPSLARQLSLVAGNADTPYGTRSDVVRDCIHIGLAMIAVRGKMPALDYLMNELQTDIDRIEHHCSELSDMVEKVCNQHLMGMTNVVERSTAQICSVFQQLQKDDAEDIKQALAKTYGKGVIALLEKGEISEELTGDLPPSARRFGG